MNEIMTLHVNTICHVPRSVRLLLAERFGQKTDFCYTHGYLEFCSSFLVPQSCYTMPTSRRKEKATNGESRTYLMSSRGLTGDLKQLWEDARYDAGI